MAVPTGEKAESETRTAANSRDGSKSGGDKPAEAVNPANAFI